MNAPFCLDLINMGSLKHKRKGSFYNCGQNCQMFDVICIFLYAGVKGDDWFANMQSQFCYLQNAYLIHTRKDFIISLNILQEDDGGRKRKKLKKEVIVGPAVDKTVAHESVGLKPVTVPKEHVIKKKAPVLQVFISSVVFS